MQNSSTLTSVKMEGKLASTWPLEGSLSERSKYHPFNLHWLDSALHETLLPGSPWEQVHAQISEKLAKSLETDLADNEEKTQMILHLLGPQFVNKYLTGMLHRPDVFDPSVFDVEKKKQLQRSTQLLLRDKLDSIVRELGYALPSSKTSTPATPLSDKQGSRGNEGGEVASDMQALLDHAKGIFKTGLERDLVIREVTQMQEKPKDLFGPTRVVKLSGSISDHLGNSLCAILQRDPSRLDSVCQRLSGKQLPSTLRSYLWAEILLRMVDDGGGGREKPSEKLTRKRFAKGVSRGKVEMKITKATECPIGGLIETAVREKFDSTPCMQPHRLDKVHSQVREALNILYTFNRSYEPFLIDWIFPLQLAFQEHQHKEEYPYELALYLHLLQTHAFPKWPEIFAVAEQAMARLQQADRELYSHLQVCAVSNVKVDPKEFLVHLIDEEKRKAAALSWSTNTDDPSNPDPTAGTVAKELLANPLIFLRKWVGEGFVGVLSTQAVMYIWDQCFLNQWDRRVFEDACLALLLLLKEKFMKAVDYHQMRQVFLTEPSKILTLDLVRAYLRIRLGQPQESVQATPKAATPEPATPEPALEKPPSPPPGRILILAAGLKKIGLKLMWNLTTSQLADFQTEKLLVTLSLSLGGRTLQTRNCKDSVLISSFTSDSGSNPEDSEQIAQEAKVKQQLSVPVPNVIFYKKESVERDRDLEPQVFLTIAYRITNETNEEMGDSQQDSENAIGWALIPVYKKETPPSPDDGDDVSTWVVSVGNQTVPLYFGEVPEDVTAEGAKRGFLAEDLLREGSEVTLTVFELVDAPWVPRDPDLPEETGDETPPAAGFDLYIDGIRFLPDNATICKVTGRVALPSDENRADLLATAVLDSSIRSPKFKYRYTVPAAEATNVAVLRVYTVDRVTKGVVVVGATILQLYVGESSKQLNAGGFQLRLHVGMPSMEELSVEAMAKLPIIPACSLLVRLLPRTEEFIPAPDYSLGYYHSDVCRPTASELRVMGHYKKIDASTTVVRKVLNRLRLEQEATEALTDEESAEWMVERLNYKKWLEPNVNEPPQRLDLIRCVNYDKEAGLYVSVFAAKAIKGEGMYPNIAAHLLPGSDLPSQSDPGSSDTEPFLVKDVKTSSPQSAPVFRDPPKKLHPSYSTKSVLLLQVIGLAVTYKPDPTGQGPGTVLSKDGTEPVSLKSDSRLGWSLLPLFDKGCVAQGMYILPIFQDDGKFSFLKELARAPDLYGWMVSAMQRGTIMLDTNYASLVVSLWDGHFDKAETIPLPKEDKFLNVDDFQKFAAAAEEVKGQPVSDIILKSLPSEARQEGVLSEMYWQEEERFKEAISPIFKDVLDTVFQ